VEVVLVQTATHLLMVRLLLFLLLLLRVEAVELVEMAIKVAVAALVVETPS
jgi:hypothetical protein